MKNKDGKFLYVVLADQIQHQIEKKSFKLSEKLPSLRTLCQETGYSMTTVFQAYIELEKRGVVESRHRSGYFIKLRLKRLRSAPEMSYHEMVPREINLDAIIHQLTEDMSSDRMQKLGGMVVAPDHLPWKRLYRHLKSIPKQQVPGMIAGLAPPQGDEQLRNQISNLLFTIVPSVSEDHIIITNGCTEVLNLSLKAVARPGDTVIIESPTDPWLRQTIKDSGIYALELPTAPDTGLDLGSAERAVNRERIACCIVNSNCQNPLGFVMPDNHKKELLRLMTAKKIPSIENDVCGELYFGKARPNPIKKWDENDSVLYCSSFSKVFAPGLRIGWIVSSQFKEKIKRMKLNRSLISPTLNQNIIPRYLSEGHFHRHLRKLRDRLKHQYTFCASALHRYFPETVKMTTPAGGLSIWIELPSGVNSRDIYLSAREQGISILPGFLCSNHEMYEGYIRVGFGGSWDKTKDDAIRKLGEMIREAEDKENS